MRPIIYRILIVPDFGVSAEAQDMVALKEAIDQEYGLTARIIDLPKMVTEEHPDQTLSMPRLLHLCAHKLETLASEECLVWDKCQAYGMCRPSVVVVFGRSAMLAGAIKLTPILFVNPEYDEESPWTSHYYIDRKEAEKFYASFREKAELNNTQSQLAAAFDDYGAPRWRQPKRIGLFTDADSAHLKEFDRRYPHLAMSDAHLRDASALAKAICEFCRGQIETPRFDIDRLLMIPERKNWEEALIVTFPRPLELRGGRKLFAVEVEGASKYRQTDTVAHIEGCRYPVSLNSICDRRDLAVLRNALREAVKVMPQRKRILIVEDCFVPSPIAEKLSKALQFYGHYVPMMFRSDGLKDWRASLEWRCLRKHFDLVVTLETGCLLAGRITGVDRLFINPNWKVWEHMKEVGCEREEWEMARKMGMKEYIHRSVDHKAMGWFTVDMIDSDEAKEHMARFGDVAYPSSISLTDEAGIRTLARHINDILH